MANLKICTYVFGDRFMLWLINELTFKTTGASSEYKNTSLSGIQARSWAPKKRTSTFSSELIRIALAGQNGKPFSFAQTKRCGIRWKHKKRLVELYHPFKTFFSKKEKRITSLRIVHSIYPQFYSNIGDFTEILPTPELLISSFSMCSAKIMNFFY